MKGAQSFSSRIYEVNQDKSTAGGHIMFSQRPNFSPLPLIILQPVPVSETATHGALVSLVTNDFWAEYGPCVINQ